METTGKDNCFDLPEKEKTAIWEAICAGRLCEQDCVEIQLYLQRFICQKQQISLPDIKTVAGIDLAYWQQNGSEHAVCCIVILDMETKTIKERVSAQGSILFPYIPGFLAFRELPLVLEAFGKLSSKPDVCMFDANGLLHPRKMGLATQAAILIGIPSLGIAKSYYMLSKHPFQMPAEEAGAFTDIILDGERLGRALRTHSLVKPVFVSVGNKMDLDGATKLALATVGEKSHIPIPTREADLDTHIMRAKNQAGEGKEA